MAHVLLLAEPSLTIQRVVQLTFANEDIDVVVVTDGAEAMAQAERVRPSIVLADVALARHSGYELAEHFKQHPRFADVPVVLLSGAFERVDAARAKASGCDLVLSKPFEPRHLLAQVKSLLTPLGGFEGPEDDTAVDPPPAVAASPAGFVTSIAPQVQEEIRDEPLHVTPSVGFGRTAFPDPPLEQPAAALEPAHLDASFPVVAPVSDAAVDVVTVDAVPDDASLPPVEWPAVDLPQVVVWPDELPAVEMPEAPSHDAPVLTAPPVPEPVAAPVVDVPVAAAPPVQALPVQTLQPQSRLDEPVPSFEMLSLSNKAMHLVPPPGAAVDTHVPESVPASPQGSHDLGDLMPSLDDYFDQLDAAFASHGDTAFRRPLDLPAPVGAPPPIVVTPVEPTPGPAPEMADQQPAPAFAPAPAPVPVVEPRQAPAIPPAAEAGADSLPPVSPFSRRRTDAPYAGTASSGSIDDAYDALMKQLQEPRPRSSVVALRADDQLLVERAVERVVAQLDSANLNDTMTEVVTTLAKRVIQEEIERIRRP